MCLVAANFSFMALLQKMKKKRNVDVTSFPSEDLENIFILVEVSSAAGDGGGGGSYRWVYLFASSGVAEQLLL